MWRNVHRENGFDGFDSNNTPRTTILYTDLLTMSIRTEILKHLQFLRFTGREVESHGANPFVPVERFSWLEKHNILQVIYPERGLNHFLSLYRAAYR